MTYHAATENGAEKLPWIQYPLIPLVTESPLPRQLVLPGTIDEKVVSVLKKVCAMLAVSLGSDVATDEACTGPAEEEGGDATAFGGGGALVDERGGGEEGGGGDAIEDGGGATVTGGDAGDGAGVCCAPVVSSVIA